MGSWWSSAGGNTSKSTLPFGITKISNSVYSFNLNSRRPEMEIVFIHGLPISDNKEEFWKTWTAEEKDGDGNEVIWPVKWLREEFPRTRIWSLRYDSSTLKINPAGKIDGFTVGENLVQEMVNIAKVGQQSNQCPIVFVCHSLGGLVVKEMVIQAQKKCGRNKKYANLLQNIRGFHFYATPHDGSKLADLASHLPDMEEMVKKLKVINDDLGRLNGEFERIGKEQYDNKWQFAVIAETMKTESHGFNAKVVEKASAQHGYNRFSAVKADHFGVCKPENRTSKSYKTFREFILDIGMEAQTLTWVNPPENRLKQ
ncbi:hypothetical protein KC19_9G187600 [Ceratodon purpureus]|uniref:DUF676 domain-containing protein n=1 Tax=Ceratodon purpureus TaxID=3225 RepID=A0A8T0GZ13_CERPU|nr:hypothetical protein KC19_9G187600 [Ceratodon purpureus]